MRWPLATRSAKPWQVTKAAGLRETRQHGAAVSPRLGNKADGRTRVSAWPLGVACRSSSSASSEDRFHPPRDKPSYRVPTPVDLLGLPSDSTLPPPPTGSSEPIELLRA